MQDKQKTKLSRNWKIAIIVTSSVVAILLTFALVIGIMFWTHKFNRDEIVVTSLPTMFVNLYDENEATFNLENVTKDNYVTSKISITNTTETFTVENAQAGFKGRGNGSWNEAKKGYKIKFDKKTSLFGREKNKHWVILACSNFEDKTMYRNYLAFNMASLLFDGIEYTTTANWVDVYVNNIYQGVYVLCEHVRVDPGRVDIESNYGELDTGYLLEYDGYASGTEGIDYFNIEGTGVTHAFTVHSPDPEDYAKENITEEQYRAQIAYVKDYVQETYTAALGGYFSKFSQLADINSFVDMYIIQEFFKNSDSGWSSFYIYKKPGGKLYAGPVWDFDATAVNAGWDSSPNGILVGDKTKMPEQWRNPLLISLYNTPQFKNLVISRWQELSPKIQKFINEQMNDDIYKQNQLALSRNYSLWYNAPMSFANHFWLSETKKLKNWFDTRIRFLNSEWK